MNNENQPKELTAQELNELGVKVRVLKDEVQGITIGLGEVIEGFNKTAQILGRAKATVNKIRILKESGEKNG